MNTWNLSTAGLPAAKWTPTLPGSRFWCAVNMQAQPAMQDRNPVTWHTAWMPRRAGRVSKRSLKKFTV